MVIKIQFRVAFFWVFISVIRAMENSTVCTRLCNGTSVNYPFGFSEHCEFKLDCTFEGRMEFKGFQIRNITWNSLSLNLSADCNRPITRTRSLFGRNYALTAQNGLLLRNCSKPLNGCIIPSSLVENRFSKCEERKENMSCYVSDNSIPGGILRYEDVSNTGCQRLFSSIIVANVTGEGNSDALLEFQAVEVGWWLTGTCGSCDRNAVCYTVGASGYRCRCNPGFSGDGFVDGEGCRNVSNADAMRPVRGEETNYPVLIGGIVAGAAFMAILACICYFCQYRSNYLKNWTSEKRFVSEAGGSSPVPIYPYKDIERATNGFSEKQRLGTGAYGTVYAGILHNNEYVAIKKIKHRDADGIEQVMNEIKLLSSVSHPNLVRLLGCCIENGEQILVYEYMANGTLSQHLQRERESGKVLPWAVRLTIASETAQAISYLHSSMNPPIYHRDIKTSNILLDFDYRSKVADFGLSRLGMEELSHISTAPQGTPGYVDPQYHQNFHLSDKSDVYSFGVVLVEIITAMKVVDFNRSHSEVNLAALAIDRIGKGLIDEIVDPFIELHRDAWTLASVHKVAELAFRCLAYHRDMRPSMMEVAHELEQIRQSGWASLDENMCMGSSVASSCSSAFNGSVRSFSGLSMKKSVGSQRLFVQQKPLDHLASLEEGKDSSPVSVHDAWFSEQSSPSTNSLLGNVIQVAHYGELAPECIKLYYRFGLALLNKAQEEADPLGAMPKKDAESRNGSVKVESAKINLETESSIASVSSKAESASSSQQQATNDVPSKDEEDDDESDTDEPCGAEEDESDLDLAWKMLDLARAISEKHSSETVDMVDILSALAEVSLEREDIETSLSDYQKALSMLESVIEPDDRRVAELNFRICLCLEVGSKAEEAIPYCQKAISVCKSRMQRLTDELKSMPGSAPSAADGDVSHSSNGSQSDNSISDKQAEIETMRSLSSDLDKKLEDLQQLVSNPTSILSDILGLAAAKARANEQASVSASAAASSSRLGVATNGDFDSPTVSSAHTNGTTEVTHLGVVGRGVKRVNMNSENLESGTSKKPALDAKPDTVDNSGA